MEEQRSQERSPILPSNVPAFSLADQNAKEPLQTRVAHWLLLLLTAVYFSAYSLSFVFGLITGGSWPNGNLSVLATAVATGFILLGLVIRRRWVVAFACAYWGISFAYDVVIRGISYGRPSGALGATVDFFIIVLVLFNRKVYSRGSAKPVLLVAALVLGLADNGFAFLDGQ